MVRELIYRKASAEHSEKEQKEQEDALYARFDAVSKELQTLKEEREKRLQKDKALSLHIRALKKSKQVLTKWDDTVWTIMIEKAIVHKDRTITFHFYNGKEIRVGA